MLRPLIFTFLTFVCVAQPALAQTKSTITSLQRDVLYFAKGSAVLSPAGRRNLAGWVKEWGPAGTWIIGIPNQPTLPETLLQARFQTISAALRDSSVTTVKRGGALIAQDGEFDPVWVEKSKLADPNMATYDPNAGEPQLGSHPNTKQLTSKNGSSNTESNNVVPVEQPSSTKSEVGVGRLVDKPTQNLPLTSPEIEFYEKRLFGKPLLKDSIKYDSIVKLSTRDLDDLASKARSMELKLINLAGSKLDSVGSWPQSRQRRFILGEIYWLLGSKKLKGARTRTDTDYGYLTAAIKSGSIGAVRESLFDFYDDPVFSYLSSTENTDYRMRSAREVLESSLLPFSSDEKLDPRAVDFCRTIGNFKEFMQKIWDGKIEEIQSILENKYGSIVDSKSEYIDNQINMLCANILARCWANKRLLNNEDPLSERRINFYNAAKYFSIAGEEGLRKDFQSKAEAIPAQTPFVLAKNLIAEYKKNNNPELLQKSLNLCKDAAKNGDKEAIQALYDVYRSGVYFGLITDSGGSENLIVFADQSEPFIGKPIADTWRGEAYKKQKKYDLAIKYFTSAKAYHNLAEMYLNGIGMKADIDKAIEYYDLAKEPYKSAELRDFKIKSKTVGTEEYYNQVPLSELSSEFYLYAQKYKEAWLKYERWKYQIKYRTTTDKLQEETNQWTTWVQNEYHPLIERFAKIWGACVLRFGDKARDMAIKADILNLVASKR